MTLTEETRARVARLFPTDAGAVEQSLEAQCGSTLPGVRADDPAWERLVERVRFAVLRLSGGDRVELERAVRLAHTDWRDVLVAAGFGEVDAHLQWRP